MENEEKLNTWLESHDGEDYCACHEPEEYLDTDAILDEM